MATQPKTVQSKPQQAAPGANTALSPRTELAVQLSNFQKTLAMVPIQKKLQVLTAGTGITVPRLCRIAMEACERNPELLKANRDSLLFAVYDCAKTGLSPDPLSGECALVPFKGKVQMLPMYKGLLKHVYQAGKVREVKAEVVCKNDSFDWARGTGPGGSYLVHKPAKENRGPVTHVYTLVTWKDGGPEAFEVMDRDDVEAIRKRSAFPDSPAWVNDWAMMAKKTVIKRQIKYFEKNMAPMAQALANIDDRHEATGEVVHFGDEDGSVIIENEPQPESGPKTPTGAPAANKSTRLDQVVRGGGAPKSAETAQQTQQANSGEAAGTKPAQGAGEGAGAPAAPAPAARTEEDGDLLIQMPKDGRRPDLDAWVKLFYARMNEVQSTDQLAQLADANASIINSFSELDPETFADIKSKLQERADELGKGVV